MVEAKTQCARTHHAHDCIHVDIHIIYAGRKDLPRLYIHIDMHIIYAGSNGVARFGKRPVKTGNQMC